MVWEMEHGEEYIDAMAIKVGWEEREREIEREMVLYRKLKWVVELKQ